MQKVSFVLFFVLAAACSRPPSGRLIVESEPVQARIGSFEVHLKRDGLALLASGKPFWATPAGKSFINAGHGQETVEESRGSFRIKDKLTAFCTDQFIKSTDVKADRLVIRGELACTGPEARVPYQLTFSASGSQVRFEARVTAVKLK